MEGVESVLLTGVKGPSFTAVKQRAEYASVVDLDLGVDSQHIIIPVSYRFALSPFALQKIFPISLKLLAPTE